MSNETSHDLWACVISHRHTDSYEPVSIENLTNQMQEGKIGFLGEAAQTQLSAPIMSRMVERVLLGHPIPPLLLNGRFGSWKARGKAAGFLKAIAGFRQGSFRLTGLKFLTKLEGKSFAGVGREVQDLFLSCEVQVAWSAGLDRPDIAESKTKGGYTS